MKLLVLCGGMGTRLSKVLDGQPKALAPINGVPFLKIQIANWKNQGVSEFVFLLGHKSSAILEFLGDEQCFYQTNSDHISFETVIESDLLGTGGAVANAIQEFSLDKDFLIINADTWLSDGIEILRESMSPTIGVVQVSNPERFGTVLFDSKMSVTAFVEKSDAQTDSAWINSGISKLSPNAFADWNGKPLSLEQDVYPKLVDEGLLKATRLNAQFIDIGIPVDYLHFCKEFEGMAE